MDTAYITCLSARSSAMPIFLPSGVYERFDDATGGEQKCVGIVLICRASRPIYRQRHLGCFQIIFGFQNHRFMTVTANGHARIEASSDRCEAAGFGWCRHDEGVARGYGL